jgi:hypothetical protein
MLYLLGARMGRHPFPPPRERPTAGQPYRIDLMPEFIRRTRDKATNPFT